MAADRLTLPPPPRTAVACHTRALARLTRPRGDLPAACAWVKPLADVDLRLSHEPEWGQCLPLMAPGAGAGEHPSPTSEDVGPRPARRVDPKTHGWPHRPFAAPPPPPPRKAPVPLPELPPRARSVSAAQLAAWARTRPSGAPTPIAPGHSRKFVGSPDALAADHLQAWFHGLGARLLTSLALHQGQTAPGSFALPAPGLGPWAEPVNGPTAPAALLTTLAHPPVGQADGQRSDRAGAGQSEAPFAARPVASSADVAHPSLERRVDDRQQPAPTGPAHSSPAGDLSEHARSLVNGGLPSTAPVDTRQGAPSAADDPRTARSPWPGLATPAPALVPLTAEIGAAELDALAEKIKRILDEEARRHGIEV